jgi:hypothetical protein
MGWSVHMNVQFTVTCPYPYNFRLSTSVVLNGVVMNNHNNIEAHALHFKRSSNLKKLRVYVHVKK